MKYYRLMTTDPYYNLAVEEYLFDTADDDVIMLWQNEPSVVVGINQNIRAEVDVAALARRGIHPVRRITGGGAVYHDGGNINYTLISYKAGGIDFAAFSRPIIDALSSLGVALTLSGRNDLCLPDGKKVSGNAECKRANKVLHHGTLLYNADLSVLGEVLTPSPEKLATKAIRSTPSRVANLKPLLPNIPSTEALIDKIEDYMITTLGAARAEVPRDEKIDILRARNASDAWLYPARGISSRLSATKSCRYPFGGVTVELSLVGEAIADIHIGGDFFGEESVAGLEQLLRGCPLARVAEELSDIKVDRYIHGMKNEELIFLIRK